MRNFIKSIFLITAFTVSAHAIGGVNQVLVNESGLAYSKAYPLDTNAIGSAQNSMGKLSAQVTFGSATIANQTFSDGSESTGSLTVVSTAPLVAASATDSITMPSTSAILGTPATGQITITSTTGLAGLPGTYTFILSNYAGIAASSPTIGITGQYSFTYGTTWASTDTIQHAAVTLSNAFNATKVFTASVINSTGVLVNLISSGTFSNGWIVTSSSPTDTSSGTFSGGANPVFVTVNNGTQNLIFTYGGNWVSSDTINHAAATLSSAMNGVGGIVTNAGGAVLYASATVTGTAGNSYTMATSSSSRVSVSSTNFSGGAGPALRNAYFTLNGINYLNGYKWSDISGTSTGTAASIANFINSASTAQAVAGGGLGSVSAVAVGGVVNLTQIITGAAGNNATLSATPSSGGLVIGSANFVGGQSNASIAINGTVLTIGKEIAPPLISSTTANLATTIATVLNANSILSPLITAQAVGSVINSTSDSVGLLTNYTTVSSAQSSLSFSHATMTGGTNSALTLNSGSIALPVHGFTTALPVLLSTGGATMGPLVNNTTYFIVVIDANHVGLSSTSAVAQTGNYLTITSTAPQVVAHTATLAPGTFIQGLASAKWQASNDTGATAINWTDLATSSSTFTPVNGGTTQGWDFGLFDYRWIQYKVIGPTQGGVSLKVNINAKD